jgi:hypothetical protein
MKRRMGLLLVIFALLVVPALAQDANVEIIGGDEDSLRQFVLRYLGSSGFYNQWC